MVLDFLNPDHLSPYSQATSSPQVTYHHACVHLCACMHTKTCIFSLQVIKKYIIFHERLEPQSLELQILQPSFDLMSG